MYYLEQLPTCSSGQVCDENTECKDEQCVCLDGYEGEGIPRNGKPGCVGKPCQITYPELKLKVLTFVKVFEFFLIECSILLT